MFSHGERLPFVLVSIGQVLKHLLGALTSLLRFRWILRNHIWWILEKSENLKIIGKLLGLGLFATDLAGCFCKAMNALLPSG